MVDVMLQHTSKIHTLLMKPKMTQQPGKPLSRTQKELFNALPQTFTKAEFLALASQLHIPKTTADRHLRLFLYEHDLAQRLSHGSYRKLCLEVLR